MTSKKDYILVSVDYSQNGSIVINDTELLTARRYNENYRERTPVVATVLEDIGEFRKGMTIVCNYTHFDDDSQYKIADGLFSIPIDELIIAIVDENGNLQGVQTNIICTRVPRETLLDMPEELQKNEFNRGVISQNGSGFKKGDFVFWYPMSDYEIVYTWKGEEKRVVKVYKDEIVAVLQS